VRLAQVFATATETLGDPDKATQWLKTPNRALRGGRPLDQLDTDPAFAKWRTCWAASPTAFIPDENLAPVPRTFAAEAFSGEGARRFGDAGTRAVCLWCTLRRRWRWRQLSSLFTWSPARYPLTWFRSRQAYRTENRRAPSSRKRWGWIGGQTSRRRALEQHKSSAMRGSQDANRWPCGYHRCPFVRVERPGKSLHLRMSELRIEAASRSSSTRACFRRQRDSSRA